MTIRIPLVTFAYVAMTSWAFAENVIPKALSETLYIPAYSEVFMAPGNSQQMAITLVFHNVDPEQTITLQVADYFDQSGDRVRALLPEAITIAPFGAWTQLIDIKDKTGGVGAKFLINWSSDVPAISPIAEALMIGGTGTQGLSFTSIGRVIAREIEDASQN